MMFNFFKNKKIISSFVNNEILKDCENKWGDKEVFLRKILSDVDFLAVLINGDSELTAFCAAKKIISKEAIAVCFLATRVKQAMRRQGLAKKLFLKIIFHFIINFKILSINNWPKPVYFVTATANPIVFKSLISNFRLPFFANLKASNKEKEKIAKLFLSQFGLSNSFHYTNHYILRNFFEDSAEYYGQGKGIPWSGDKKIDILFEDTVNLKKKEGNGLLIIRRIL